MTEYEVSAVACYVAGDYEAESAEEAIQKAREDVEDALDGGDFHLTEVEAMKNGDGNDWAIWEA